MALVDSLQGVPEKMSTTPIQVNAFFEIEEGIKPVQD